MDFFASVFGKGASYGTLNSYRAAIGRIIGGELTQDPQVKKCFRGAYNIRPNPPKYEDTWDPELVLNLARKLPNDGITLEQLTWKLAVLLAICTGQRVQTLHNIEVQNVTVDDKIEIKIPERLKSSGRNVPQSTLILPFFHSVKDICPATAVQIYLEKTKPIRGTTEKLFITTKPPFRSASTQTISRWIKAMLRASGIDTDKDSSYTTSHASSSAAARRGFNYDTIRKAAC
ncbi:unnamed protein product [Acanthoscelides obtectus]|uniref:Tyr recombinase domain-containing protein n=1 Tax=Acanthoscelides obtectus TaxID=200917 RepID=A0A9P0Q3Z2_ACAOB|nr:unnamed protein product [Acanthoscelides obtectus]CAK1631673.1 hypothetical protein AOBTE_LOCUS7085 [Acanthoscelides obtectus]